MMYSVKGNGLNETEETKMVNATSMTWARTTEILKAIEAEATPFALKSRTVEELQKAHDALEVDQIYCRAQKRAGNDVSHHSHCLDSLRETRKAIRDEIKRRKS
jgi:hypothetical protein